MIRLLLILFLVIGCEDSEKSTKLLSPSPTTETDEALIEYGEVEDVEEVTSTFYANTCDVFEDSPLGLMMSDIYPGHHQNCENVKEHVNYSLVMTANLASVLLDEMDPQAHQNCQKIAKRSLKKMKRYFQKKYLGDDLKMKLAHQRILKNLRRMNSYGCIELDEDDVTLTNLDGEDVNFVFTTEHLVNNNFFVIKDKQSNQLSYLDNGWTILEQSNVPGWRVKGVSSECKYLEFQVDGLVADATHGGHVIELDSHCRGMSSNVEISQTTHITKPGVYKLEVWAQKRSGVYGKLETTIYQHKRDKIFVEANLPDEAQWTKVCQDIDISNQEKSVKVAIRDNADDRNNFGILIDKVSLSEGACDN